MNRILCIGNRYLDRDAAGPRVYDALMGMALPSDVEVEDGGIAGLNLLGLIDGVDHLVFVDAIVGYLPGGGIRLLGPEELPSPDQIYDHGSGLLYLLHTIPRVCDRPPASITIVGIEGPGDEELIKRAARLSLDLMASRSRQPALAGRADWNPTARAGLEALAGWPERRAVEGGIL